MVGFCEHCGRKDRGHLYIQTATNPTTRNPQPNPRLHRHASRERPPDPHPHAFPHQHTFSHPCPTKDSCADPTCASLGQVD